MLAAFCLALLSVVPDVKAYFPGSLNILPELQVTVDGRLHTILPVHSVARRFKTGVTDGRHHPLRYRGIAYLARGLDLVNQSTGEAFRLTPPAGVPPPYPGIWNPRCQGALALKRGMLWVYAWCDGDTMGEPTGALCAFVVDVEKGKLVQRAAVDLPGVGGHYGVRLFRHGGDLALYGDGGTFAILDLATLKYIPAWRQTAAKPTGKAMWSDGGAVVSDSGRVYLLDGGMLRIWSWGSRTWKEVRKALPLEASGARWLSAFGAGNDDLLVSSSAIALARSGKVVQLRDFPNGSPPVWDLFFDPTIGAGLIWQTDSQSVHYRGTLLHLTDLSEICPIRCEH